MRQHSGSDCAIGFFEQDVITRLDGLHARLEVHVLGRSDQDGVGRDGVFEKAFVVGEALFGLQSEFGGDCVAARNPDPKRE
jgi:hypothetical protein